MLICMAGGRRGLRASSAGGRFVTSARCRIWGSRGSVLCVRGGGGGLGGLGGLMFEVLRGRDGCVERFAGMFVGEGDRC